MKSVEVRAHTGASARRPGRPASDHKKVTVTIRLPMALDTFLNARSQELGQFKSDLIAQTLIQSFGSAFNDSLR